MIRVETNGVELACEAFGVPFGQAILLDALSIDRAHVVGRSMGGMIAQIMACEHPDRVASLTSIMSSTGNPSLPPPTPDAMATPTIRCGGSEPTASSSGAASGSSSAKP